MRPDRTRTLLLGVLFSSVVVLTNLLFKRETLVILAPTGDPIIITSPLMYGLVETLGISIASAAAGFSLALLIAKRWEGSTSSPSKVSIKVAEGIMRILDQRDRDIVRLLLRKGGEVLQSEVWAELRMSKATASRRLDSLEERGIIVREKFGGTYRVKLSGWLKEVLRAGHRTQSNVD